MTKVLVTGAGGYVGRHVVQRLAELGIPTVAVDLQVPQAPLDGVSYRAVDILGSTHEVSALFDEGIPDACIHLAWRNGFKHDDASHMLDLSAHYRFLMELVAAGVPRLAVMGTMHEVGYWEGAITEDTPCNPLSLYGIAKDSLRRALLLDASKEVFDLKWLRGFYIYGDDEQSQSIFGKLVRAARSGQATFPFTTGKNKYDFMTVQSLADMIVAASLQDSVSGIINCCTGHPVSLADKVEEFIAENGLDIKLEYGVYPDRPYDSPGVWGDASRIETILSGAACP